MRAAAGRVARAWSHPFALRHLNRSLSYNRLSGAVPEAIGALAKLQALFLEQNKLEGSAPPSIAGLGALQLACAPHPTPQLPKSPSYAAHGTQ